MKSHLFNVSRTNVLKGLFGVRQLPRAERSRVLFTFDDGPHPDGTVRVLDVLRRFDARAVFFVVGSRIHRAPWLLRRILDEGHVLGNHSFLHEGSEMAGLARYRADLLRCQAEVERLTGTRPRVFRPPLGEVTVGSTFVPRKLGLRSVLWSIDSNDWRMRSPADVATCSASLRDAFARPHLRDIVLMHDERPFTAMVLEEVLPMLVDRAADVRTGVEAL